MTKNRSAFFPNAFWLAAGCALGALAVFFLPPALSRVAVSAPSNLARAAENGADVYRYFDLFGDIFEIVRADYVEEKDERELVETAIRGMISSLDPHSNYLTQKSFRDMQTRTRGEFGGLGIEVTMKNGVVAVIAPIAGTPAERAGVQPGDLITGIDGERVLGLSLSEAVEKMRGRPGTKIDLAIRREGFDAPITISIIRAIITIEAVKARLEGRIGYIQITTFSEQAVAGVRSALGDFRRELGALPDGVIVDLRNNPGGLLDQAVAVADVFLDGGEVVSTRRRAGVMGQRYNARAGDALEGRPVIILINGGSASASEIVAGALQDQRRAAILGTRSFGKGSVQTVQPLGPDRGALRITIARYYTPSGRAIQAHGVEPDIIIEQSLTAEQKVNLTPAGETHLRGHLSGGENGGDHSGSISYVPRDETQDTQLNRALTLLRQIAAARLDAARETL